MQISDDAIREFKALYRAEFGIALDGEQARQKALDLLEAVALIYRLDWLRKL